MTSELGEVQDRVEGVIMQSQKLPIRPFCLWVLVASFTVMAGCSSQPAHLPENAYADKTEAAVRSELGEPHHQFAGHYGAPRMDFTKQFAGEIKTLVFKKPGGEYYVSLEKRPSGWVSIR